MPAVPAPQRLNAAAATARLPLLSAVDALSVQQQATILAAAPDVALCAGNGYVVEVVNQVGAWRTAAAQRTAAMPGNATCMRSHAGKRQARALLARAFICAALPPLHSDRCTALLRRPCAPAAHRSRSPPQLMAVFAANGSTVTPPTALPTFFGSGAPFDRPGFFAQPSCALLARIIVAPVACAHHHGTEPAHPGTTERAEHGSLGAVMRIVSAMGAMGATHALRMRPAS